MNKFLEVILWIITDILLALGIALIPSVFSILSLLTAILLIPIESWREFLKKIFKKSFTVIILMLCTASLILFPYSQAFEGVVKLITPVSSSKTVSVSFENFKPFPQDISFPSTTSSSDVKSSNSNSTSKSTSNISKSENQNTDEVFRTPTGKKYHFSKDCGGKNSYIISFEQALNDNLNPCKKCAQ